jgi:hypothetical protein
MVSNITVVLVMVAALALFDFCVMKFVQVGAAAV